jgi:phage repressor protein C with HTH and peptisase S24 domain
VGTCLYSNESYVLQRAGKHLFIRKVTMNFARGILLHAFNKDDQPKGSHKEGQAFISK